jgi:regulatory protein
LPIVYEQYSSSPPKKISLGAALVKIAKYCAYQERTHREVRNKLFEFGLHPDQVEELISKLITENYISEERYAIAFARGKSNSRRWGKQKIAFELQKKGVSKNNIKTGLAAIDEETYLKNAMKLINERLKIETKKPEWQRKILIIKFMTSKGYEPDLVSNFLLSVNN